MTTMFDCWYDIIFIKCYITCLNIHYILLLKADLAFSNHLSYHNILNVVFNQIVFGGD